MAIANLHETLLTCTTRINALNLQISEYQSQKALAVYQQGDAGSIKAQDEEAVRQKYRKLFEENPEYKEKYKDFTEIPDFEEEIDKITALYNDQLSELTAWETQLDAQITTASAELQEQQAYKESWKSMLSSNIQNDFSYGQNK